MVEIFKKLLADSFFNTDISIKPFNAPHIVYLLIIFGFIVGSYFLLRNKSVEYKTAYMKILVVALTFSYLSDFFTHIYVYPDMGGLNYDKLPFHICTVLCPLSCYAQFGK